MNGAVFGRKDRIGGFSPILNDIPLQSQVYNVIDNGVTDSRRDGANRKLDEGENDEEFTLDDQRARRHRWFCNRPGGGGLTVSGTASMGVLGGAWIVDRGSAQGIGRDNCGTNPIGDPIRDPDVSTQNPFRLDGTGCPIPGQSKFELHTDIDVTFAMSGQTDTGLTFGASIDLDESDGKADAGNSLAFDGRTQGGEEIFVSGAFGTLTMGDTDGALDWALQEIGIGSSLGDAHTVHAGYNGNDFADGYGGQIVRYEHSFGDFAVAVSVNPSDGSPNDAIPALGREDPNNDPFVALLFPRDDILAAGAKYNATLMAVDLGVGIGWSQLGHGGKDNDALGISLDADFGNGFRAILNWVDMGDSPDHEKDFAQWRVFEGAGDMANPNYEYNILDEDGPERYMGIGLGYAIDDWTFAINFGLYTEDQPDTTEDPEQRGFAVVVNYDLGGGAELQLGYSKSTCKAQIEGVETDDPAHPDYFPRTGGAVYHGACNHNDENSALSLGVAMNF